MIIDTDNLTEPLFDLVRSSQRDIDELLAVAADRTIVNCDNCVIKAKCNSQIVKSCRDIWLEHLRGGHHGQD